MVCDRSGDVLTLGGFRVDKIFVINESPKPFPLSGFVGIIHRMKK